MKKLLLDPGHGGADPGAVGNGVHEADVALMYCENIAEFLDEMAPGEVDVKFTHRGEGKSLQGRCDIANEWGADLFVSVHCNAAQNPDANGFEVFTSRGETGADAVATAMYSAVRAEFLGVFKPRHDWEDGDPDREANYYVLRHTAMRAVLFELGFISNDWDRSLMLNPDIVVRYASRLAAVILEVV